MPTLIQQVEKPMKDVPAHGGVLELEDLLMSQHNPCVFVNIPM